MNTKYILIFLSVFLCTKMVFSNEIKPAENVLISTSSVKIWTIEDCLARAMEDNPSIRSAQEGLRAASGRNYMTMSEFVPSISWNTVYYKKDKASLGSLASAITGLSPSMYSDNFYTSNLSADWTLFSWRIKPLRRTIRSNTKLAALKLESAKNDLNLNVKKAFYTALYAKELMIIAQSAEDIARENLETSERLYKVGRVSSFDVSRARVRSINTKTAVISAKNFVSVSIEGLRMVLSLPSGEAVDINGEFLQNTKISLLNDEINNALQFRPELNIAKEAENLQVSSLETARAGFLPVVFTGITYSWESLEFIDTKNNYFTSWTARAGISIPIFDGLFSIGRFSSEKAGLKQAREQVRGASDGVIMEVRQSYYSLANAQESLQAQKENVETAAENLRIAQERYKMGFLSLLELKDAELSLIEARTQQLKVLYDYNISLVSLDRAVGLRPEK